MLLRYVRLSNVPTGGVDWNMAWFRIAGDRDPFSGSLLRERCKEGMYWEGATGRGRLGGGGGLYFSGVDGSWNLLNITTAQPTIMMKKNAAKAITIQRIWDDVKLGQSRPLESTYSWADLYTMCPCELVTTQIYFPAADFVTWTEMNRSRYIFYRGNNQFVDILVLIGIFCNRFYLILIKY